MKNKKSWKWLKCKKKKKLSFSSITVSTSYMAVLSSRANECIPSMFMRKSHR